MLNRARVRCFADVIVVRTDRVNFNLAVEQAVRNQFTKYTLGGWRAANVGRTNKKDFHVWSINPRRVSCTNFRSLHVHILFVHISDRYRSGISAGTLSAAGLRSDASRKARDIWR